jgi:hypothetical protein
MVFRKLLTLSALLGLMAFGRSQTPSFSCTPQDRAIFGDLMQGMAGMPAQSIGETLVEVGTQFIGTPYVASTLELEGQEKLVVNLRGLDCTTFVENVLAISRLICQEKQSWESYLQTLEHIRYRKGQLKGYPSRLHYFTDWIRDNQEKGLVRDITPQAGGVPVVKEINFMGTHPELYPALGQKEYLEEIRKVEASLSSEALSVLPAEAVAGQEGLLRDGDIIALATETPGLDVTHTGIAITGVDGRIHLLHASTKGAVMISKEPLAEYLKKIRGNTGIIVVRPSQPGG